MSLMRKVHFCEAGRDLPIPETAALIAAGFDQIEASGRIAKAKNIVIKPNLVTDNPDYISRGANSEPFIIESIVAHLRENYPNAKVSIGESETGTKVKGRKLARAYKYMGLYELSKKYDVDLLNFTAEPKVAVTPKKSLFIPSFDLPRPIVESDLVINIPKIKTHKYSTITCSIKNMFGTIPDPLRIRYHADIHKTIVDLITIYEDKMIVVVDGLVAMEGSGPLWGTPVELNVLGFGNHPFEMDWHCASSIGFNPKDIRHLRYYMDTYRQGGAPIIEYSGEPIANYSRKFEPCHKNLFIKTEGQLMKYSLPRALIFNPWIQKNIIYFLAPIFKKFRGGSYTWYVEDEKPALKD